jgi:hypothetical protein
MQSELSSQKDAIGRTCSMHVRGNGYVYNFIVEPEGIRPLGSLTCRWEDYMKRDLKEMGWVSVGWINLA